MAEPTIPTEHSSGDAGFAEHLRALVASVAGYLHARLQLAGLESKEAAAHYLQILLWLAAAAFAALLGYVFLCGALMFILAWLLEVKWVWVMLGFGLAHILAAFACAVIVRKKFPRPVFGATLNEFKKDQEWLTTQTKPN